MFGSLGGSEVVFIFILALLLFGPRKLPEIGRTLGKAVGEFRRATQDFRMSLEREVELDKIKEATRGVESAVRDTFSRGSVLGAPESAAAPAPETAGNRATPGAPAPSSEDAAGTAPETPAPDGGSSSVH